ncbi:hypothetical protein AB0878_47925 [Amycolatopsis sp. NPDC047767]|uniref:hypothetical protein n=1 Tax=Amycolatopsis sp. NPDC047767 TaxID=3156765 RepID=UPI0034541C52
MTTTKATIPVPESVFAVLSEEFGSRLRRAVPLMRHPDDVMSPSVLRGMAASKLSFAQTLVRRMTEGKWRIELVHCELSEDGTGFLAYDIQAEGLQLSFGVFVYPPLPPGHTRMFRDTKLEFLGILLEGPIDVARFRRERDEADTNLWRGRTDPKVYGWTIASRGTRMFDDVVAALVRGEQPTVEQIDANGGYILRNGGFYGNGRMGTRAWRSYARGGGPLAMPYHIDLFCVYLWRLVSLDLVEATARMHSPSATVLRPSVRRHVGIGNSSGLGTVAALVRWPSRLASFILPRELGFAYTAAQTADAASTRRLADLVGNARDAYRNAPEAAPELIEPRESVATALDRVHKALVAADPGEETWARFLEDAEDYGSVEAAEVLRSLLLEVYPETYELSRITEAFTPGPEFALKVDPEMSVGELRAILREQFAWCVDADLESPGKREFFWYRSEENGENRRGERSVDVGIERETVIDVAGAVRRLADFLDAYDAGTSIGRFLLDEPEHTLAVARAQFAATTPYSEIRASVCDADFLASNTIRCFLAILGIELPTPHSGRWVRGLFYRDAPLPADLVAGREGAWGVGAPAAADQPRDEPAMGV